MALDPNFVANPLTNNVTFNTANTAGDGTGSISSLLTAGVNGALVFRIRVKATGTTTAGMLRLFHSTNGTTWRLIDEQAVDAATPSATVKSFSWLKTFEGSGFVLQAGHSLGISTHKAESFHATVEWGGM